MAAALFVLQPLFVKAQKMRVFMTLQIFLPGGKLHVSVRHESHATLPARYAMGSPIRLGKKNNSRDKTLKYYPRRCIILHTTCDASSSLHRRSKVLPPRILEIPIEVVKSSLN